MIFFFVCLQMEVSGSDIGNGCGNGERHEEEKQKPGGEASTEEGRLRLFLRGSRTDGMKKMRINRDPSRCRR